jgi:hypothetical protein
MPKGAMFAAAYDIRNILTEIVAQRGLEKDVKGGWSCMRTMQGYIQQKWQERFATPMSCELRHIHHIHWT